MCRPRHAREVRGPNAPSACRITGVAPAGLGLAVGRIVWACNPLHTQPILNECAPLSGHLAAAF